MADRDSRHGQDSDEILNLPIGRDEIASCEDDHSDESDEGERHAELKFAEDFGDFDEEVGELGLFGGGAPGHVDFEHMC